jgi:hypothetical protein
MNSAQRHDQQYGGNDFVKMFMPSRGTAQIARVVKDAQQNERVVRKQAWHEGVKESVGACFLTYFVLAMTNA